MFWFNSSHFALNTTPRTVWYSLFVCLFVCLQECIRAIDSGKTHIPYRASKLTMVLKSSFSRKSRCTIVSVLAFCRPQLSYAFDSIHAHIFARAIPSHTLHLCICHGQISCVSPTVQAQNHTLNTLRYHGLLGSQRV